MDSDFQPWELTTDTIKALRSADGVSFHFRKGETVDAWIFGRRTVKQRPPFRDAKQDFYVTAAQKFTVYEGDGTSGRRMPIEAYTSVSPAQFHPQWQTAAKHLRAGDRLHLHWTGGDSRLNLKEAGLVLVDFDLEVARKVGKAGREERLVFRLDSHLTRTAGSPLKFPSGEYELNV